MTTNLIFSAKNHTIKKSSIKVMIVLEPKRKNQEDPAKMRKNQEDPAKMRKN
jgi:hypothetical protein